MTTERQREARRRNGRLSRGPKTAEGKARSRLNALTHGLTAKSAPPPERALAVARAMWTGPGDPPMEALEAAEAHLQLEAVRRARALTLTQAAEVFMKGGATEAPDEALSLAVLGVPGPLHTLDGYARKALSRRSRALRRLGLLEADATDAPVAGGEKPAAGRPSR